jgi:hypothetical protein
LTFALAFGHEKTENSNDHSSGEIGMAQANALFRLKKTSTATTLFRQGLANTPTAATITNATAEIPTQQEQSLDFMELSKWCSAHAPALHKTLHSFITSRWSNTCLLLEFVLVRAVSHVTFFPHIHAGYLQMQFQHRSCQS